MRKGREREKRGEKKRRDVIESKKGSEEKEKEKEKEKEREREGGEEEREG